MAKPSAKRAAGKASVRTPTTRRGKPQTNANSLANLKPPWKAGDPSPNPGGRPKILSDAYRKYLDLAPNPRFLALLSEWGAVPQNNAELIAASAIQQAVSGDTQAAREIRSATEGTKLRDYIDDITDVVRDEKATLDDVRAEFGTEIMARVAARLGILPSQNRPIQGEGATD